MIRLAPAAFAGVAFAVPLLVVQVKAVAGVCLVGLCLAILGIIASWRWAVTGAAGTFLLAYAVALLLAEAPPRMVVSAGLGLAIFLQLQSADLALRAHRAAGDLSVLRVHFTRWLALGGGVLGTAVLGVALAVALVPALPAAAAPFLAGAGALGMVVSAAAIVARAARRPPLGAQTRGTPALERSDDG